MPSLEQQVLDVVEIKLRGNADRQVQLHQIVEAINGSDDEKWRQLPPAGQKWFNAATEALDEGKKIKDFADSAAQPAKSKPVKEDSKVAKSAAKKTKKPAKAAGKREGAPVLIRRWVIKNPKITAKECDDKLKQRGYTVSFFTVSAIRSVCLATLRQLAVEGHPAKGIAL